MAHGLLPLTPNFGGNKALIGCEWLTDYYQQHHLYHWKHPPEVVNGLQITTTYTFVTVVGEFFVVVNGLQKSKKDLRKENPVIAGGIFLFLFDDDFL